MTLRLQLFGTPVLYQNDVPIEVNRRKAMALLSYLAVTGGRHHRETLASLLWPESSEIAAASAFRNILWILRQSPASDMLRSDRYTLELVESAGWAVDVNQFRRLAACCPAGTHHSMSMCAECEPMLKQAVRLWRGPFMRGFAVSNSAQFEDWLLAEGEALKRELTETLDRMIEYYLSIGDWASGAQFAREWIQAEPLNEIGYRRLMQSLSAQGNRSDALHVFEECSAILSMELGVSPEELTCRLAEEIRTKKTGSVDPTMLDRAHRLPHALVPFVGRQKMAAKLETLILTRTARVLTIAGLGGSGKTSLALHVGRQVEHHFTHGAVIVPLDSMRGENAVVLALASALGFSLCHESPLDAIDQLADFVRDRNLLLILDGIEGVLPQVSALLPILEIAPGVQFLLTSRIALGASCEVAIALQGLEFPEAGSAYEDLADYPAVRLLRLFAQRRGSSSGSDDTELAGMARLARLLEGSPLGLEMAAGWRSALAWNEIADRISDDPAFLTWLWDDVSPKHRSFVAVFEQGWGMLTPDAQRAFRRLSVFRSHFTIDAAEYVAEASPSDLALLVNRSLLKRTGFNRYEMHELLRQFASGKLGAVDGDTSRAHDRHTEYYLLLVERWNTALEGPEQHKVLQEMNGEMTSIRAAFQYAAERGRSELLRASCEGLLSYYNASAHLAEGAHAFTNASRAYEQSNDRDATIGAFLMIAAAYLGVLGEPSRASRQKLEAMSLVPKSPPIDRLHAAVNVLAASISFGKDRDANRTRLEESLSFYVTRNDKEGEAGVLATWANFERYHDRERAEQLALASLRLQREAGNKIGEAYVLHFLARLAEERNELELALAQYGEAQRLTEPMLFGGFGEISILLAQARIEGKLGRYESSARLAARALFLGRERGYRYQMGRALLELARMAHVMGDRESARTHLDEAFSLLGHQQWAKLQLECAILLLEIALDESDAASAERWLHEVSVLGCDAACVDGYRQRLDALRR